MIFTLPSSITHIDNTFISQGGQLVRSIYVITHGDKKSGPNPGMTSVGFRQIATLPPLPKHPSAVIVGTGKRHTETAEILNLKPTSFTSLLGDAASAETIDGHRMAILADGNTTPLEMHSTIKDLRPAARAFLLGLADNTICCSGRPFMKALGFMIAKSGALYKISINQSEAPLIEELIALGETED